MRRTLLALSALLPTFVLEGCGFHPLFAGPEHAASGQQVFHSIYVEPITGERVGYELRNSLIDALRGPGRPDQAQYRLNVTVQQTIEGVAVETNASITRYRYTMTAEYELTDIHTGASLTKGKETAISAYDVVASPYATLVAQQDAQRLGAQDVAERIRIDLGVYFSKRGG